MFPDGALDSITYSKTLPDTILWWEAPVIISFLSYWEDASLEVPKPCSKSLRRRCLFSLEPHATTTFLRLCSAHSSGDVIQRFYACHRFFCNVDSIARWHKVTFALHSPKHGLCIDPVTEWDELRVLMRMFYQINQNNSCNKGSYVDLQAR